MHLACAVFITAYYYNENYNDNTNDRNNNDSKIDNINRNDNDYFNYNTFEELHW